VSDKIMFENQNKRENKEIKDRLDIEFTAC